MDLIDKKLAAFLDKRHQFYRETTTPDTVSLYTPYNGRVLTIKCNGHEFSQEVVAMNIREGWVDCLGVDGEDNYKIHRVHGIVEVEWFNGTTTEWIRT